jgi:aspartate ammonia-lyase
MDTNLVTTLTEACSNHDTQSVACSTITETNNCHHNNKLVNRFAMQHDASVSSILLQENRFSPLLAAGFFLPVGC